MRDFRTPLRLSALGGDKLPSRKTYLSIPARFALSFFGILLSAPLRDTLNRSLLIWAKKPKDRLCCRPKTGAERENVGVRSRDNASGIIKDHATLSYTIWKKGQMLNVTARWRFSISWTSTLLMRTGTVVTSALCGARNAVRRRLPLIEFGENIPPYFLLTGFQSCS